MVSPESNAVRETFEFRIPESSARQWLPSDAGVRLGPLVRKLVLRPMDPLFAEIGRIEREFRGNSGAFFTAWIARRHYSSRELKRARLLTVNSSTLFEPAGEECGTVYDEASACPLCGAGAKQTTSLFLDVRKIPRRSDFTKTIAGEIVVSRALVEVFRRCRLTGARFEPVRESNRAGIPSDHWYQLVVVAPAVDLAAATRCGSNPFDDGPEPYGRCPRGDVAGLNVLSEIWVQCLPEEQADVLMSKQLVGNRRGLLRPEPVIFISPRAYNAMKEVGLRGWRVEVAHVVT